MLWQLFGAQDVIAERIEGARWHGGTYCGHLKRSAELCNKNLVPIRQLIKNEAVFLLQAHPGLTAASFPWPSGAAYKRKALTFPYTAGALVYVRDKDSGEVYLGADGLPRMKYWPSAFDRASMIKVSNLVRL